MPDLFALIERQLDTELATQPHRAQFPKGLASLVLGLVLGAAMAMLVLFSLSHRQQIVARPAPNVAWSHLGEVTLHGQDLRAFVRAKCQGHTHFYITMHGFAAPKTPGDGDGEVPLMNPGEKILMECIF